MPRLNFPLDGGFYESDSLPISAQECVNWYVNIPQTEGALSPATLFGGSGITQVDTTGTLQQINRGMHVKAGVPYFVNGTSLYRLDRTVDAFGDEVFSLVNLGVVPGTNRVSMADNGKQLMVLIPGGDGFIIDETAGTVFLQITDAGFTANGAPQIVVFIDSFFVCSTDSKKFIKSAANDGNSWNALDFGSAESDPDDITSLHVFKNKLYVAGAETIEEEQNVGIGGFPFQRTGFFINKGVFAPFSMISTDTSFMWIGGGVNESPSIWALAGNQAQKVSTTAIDAALQDFTEDEIDLAFAYTYSQRGAAFVGFSLPTVTFEYNTVTGKWNERKSQVLNDLGVVGVLRWRVNSIGTAYNRVLCGDSQDGRIGSIEVDTFTEYDNEIIRTIATRPLQEKGESLIVSEVEATFEAGVADATTPDPVVRLSTSKNGKTYNNELSRSIGAIGEFGHRAIWNRLGRFPRFSVFKFEFSEPVKPVFIKLELRVKASQRGN